MERLGRPISAAEGDIEEMTRIIGASDNVVATLHASIYSRAAEAFAKHAHASANVLVLKRGFVLKKALNILAGDTCTDDDVAALAVTEEFLRLDVAAVSGLNTESETDLLAELKQWWEDEPMSDVRAKLSTSVRDAKSKAMAKCGTKLRATLTAAQSVGKGGENGASWKAGVANDAVLQSIASVAKQSLLSPASAKRVQQAHLALDKEPLSVVAVMSSVLKGYVAPIGRYGHVNAGAEHALLQDISKMRAWREQLAVTKEQYDDTLEDEANTVGAQIAATVTEGFLLASITSDRVAKSAAKDTINKFLQKLDTFKDFYKKDVRSLCHNTILTQAGRFLLA
eukprot:5422194-Amphidinium_carterae.3